MTKEDEFDLEKEQEMIQNEIEEYGDDADLDDDDDDNSAKEARKRRIDLRSGNVNFSAKGKRNGKVSLKRTHDSLNASDSSNMNDWSDEEESSQNIMNGKKKSTKKPEKKVSATTTNNTDTAATSTVASTAATTTEQPAHPNKSRQARYEPDGESTNNMSKYQLSVWRREARRVRNRESAAASRQKTKEKIEELESEVATLKAKYSIALEHYHTILEIHNNSSSIQHDNIAIPEIPDEIRRDLIQKKPC